MKLKKTVFALTTFCFVLSGTDFYSLIDVSASNCVVYNLNEATAFKDRTIENVVQKINETEALIKETGYSSNYYDENPSLESPYHQGKLSQSTLSAMQIMTDYYRWLVGSPKLISDCIPNEVLQYQALDRNFGKGHFIKQTSKPDDMPQELWDKGFECTHNVLAGGYTPVNSISGWVNEGYSLSTNEWDDLGHRYLLMEPVVSEIQYGYCGRVALGDVVRYGNAENVYSEYYVFPAPGAFPSNYIKASESAWTFDFTALASGDYYAKSESDVTVIITNKNTGREFKRSVSEGTVKYSGALFGGSGLAFVQPDDLDSLWSKYKDTYTVEIDGLTVSENDEESPLRIIYDVEFFDVNNLPKPVMTGDIDGNGVIDITDLSSLSIYLIGDLKLDESGLKAADVDHDGDVRLTDLAKLRQFISKVISTLD